MTDPTAPAPAASELGPRTAAALVFGTSAAVLVVEIVALRLLAPYFGLTLETSTLVIGIALAAIAAGSVWGGRAADRYAPRSLLGPLLAIPGLVVVATPAVVRTAAETDRGLLFLAASLSILVPGALLSAVTPVVIKMRLRSLEETGSVVGRLSGIGTVGAIAGTVLTGFVLISYVSVSVILVVLGLALVGVGIAFEIGTRTRRSPGFIGAVLVAALGTVLIPDGCDRETKYHCLSVDVDPERDTGRILVLDGIRNSYVDLEDPTYLEFSYIKAIASVLDEAFPAEEPLRGYHLGAGGLTIPYYLKATRPGTTSVVSEIDAGVVEANTELLGREPDDTIDVRVEDGRLALEDLPAGSVDVVVGDAFGGVSVPWHLTTVEAVSGIQRALDDSGIYVVNLIDNGPLDFARAAVATAAEVFDHVALMSDRAVLAGETGGNLVLLASDSAPDLQSIAAGVSERDAEWELISGAALDDWVGGAPVLTDDYAPVDQLLTPYNR